MSRAKDHAHLVRKYTKPELADIILVNQKTIADLRDQLNSTAEQRDRNYAEAVEAQGRRDGLQVDVERFRERRDEDRVERRKIIRDAETVRDKAEGQIIAMQANLDCKDAEMTAAGRRADWYQTQRDRLAGIIEGLRGDSKDDGKRRRMDKVLASLTQDPVHGFVGCAGDPVIERVSDVRENRRTF